MILLLRDGDGEDDPAGHEAQAAERGDGAHEPGAAEGQRVDAA